MGISKWIYTERAEGRRTSSDKAVKEQKEILEIRVAIQKNNKYNIEI